MIQINPAIEEKLREAFAQEEKANLEGCVHSGLQYLLSIYFGLSHGNIPVYIIRAVNIAKICERDYTKNEIRWNIPLFLQTSSEGQGSDTNWDWVLKEYRPMFKLRPEGMGGVDEVLSKMKKFFAKNPHVRKEQVMDAARAYLHQFTQGGQNPKYMQAAGYFISKVIEGGKQSRLEQWLETIASQQQEGQDRHTVIK